MLNQIPIDEWPSQLTEEVAVLDKEPDHFEHAGLLRFEENFDDLDYFRAAIVSQNGLLFALKRYRNCPSPGVGVWVSRGSAESMRHDLYGALETLRLRRAVVTWTREDVGGKG